MIDHIALQVADVERSATFSTDVFGHNVEAVCHAG
jgi:catechol 2,3-dioxygenase-like lactoylglutathione lyase family enzyme